MRWMYLAIAMAIVGLAMTGCAAKLGPGKYGWVSWNLENKLNLDLKVPAIGDLCIGCLYTEADPNAPKD